MIMTGHSSKAVKREAMLGSVAGRSRRERSAGRRKKPRNARSGSRWAVRPSLTLRALDTVDGVNIQLIACSLPSPRMS